MNNSFFFVIEAKQQQRDWSKQLGLNHYQGMDEARKVPFVKKKFLSGVNSVFVFN